MMPKNSDNMKVLPVLISFHTDGWIQRYIKQHLSHFPDHKILMVDNNPLPNDTSTGQHHIWRKNKKPRRGTYNFDSSWRESCEHERRWATQHPNLTVIRPPPGLETDHGNAIEIAADWLRRNNVDIMLHVEPDCTMTGSKWYHQLLDPILKDDMWSTFGNMLCTGIGHICPSMWRIDKVRHGFYRQPKGADKTESHYLKVFKDHDNWTHEYWDTGQKCWYEFDKLGKTKHVPLHDFVHLREGSCIPYHSCIKHL